MPKLHEHKNGKSCYTRINLGIAITTWQITPQGVEWLRKRNVHVGDEFSYQQFQKLKNLRYAVEGSRVSTDKLRSHQTGQAASSNLLSSSGGDGHYRPGRASSRPGVNSSATTKQRVENLRPASLLPVKYRKQPPSSPQVLRLRPVAQLNRPRLLLRLHYNGWQLELLLPGYIEPNINRRRELGQCQLLVVGERRVRIIAMAGQNHRVVVPPMTSRYDVCMVQPVPPHIDFGIWTRGVQGLNPRGTFFHAGGSCPRIDNRQMVFWNTNYYFIRKTQGIDRGFPNGVRPRDLGEQNGWKLFSVSLPAAPDTAVLTWVRSLGQSVDGSR